MRQFLGNDVSGLRIQNETPFELFRSHYNYKATNVCLIYVYLVELRGQIKQNSSFCHLAARFIFLS